MLTALNIDKKVCKSKISKTINSLLRDKIKVNIVQTDTIKIKCVTYVSHRDRINFKRIDKFVGVQRNHLLCSKDVILPRELGYKRFDNYEYRVRLCTNMALYLLQSIDTQKAVSVCLVDMNAQYTQLCEEILKYTDKLTIITDNIKVYTEIADELMVQSGAVLKVTRNFNPLSFCDLLISPVYVDNICMARENTLVFTVSDEEHSCSSVVLTDYEITLKDKINKLKPKCISDTYFASALYTLEKVYNLGCLVPVVCVGAQSIYTPQSLKKLLANKVNNLT